VAVGFDHGGAEAPFEQAAGAPVFAVVPGNIQAAELLHHRRQALFGVGCGQQVQMGRQQSVSVDRNPVGTRGFGQPAEEALIILGLAEDALAVVAALEDVVRLLGEDEAGLAGHGRGR
jgi:hypothetical protein